MNVLKRFLGGNKGEDLVVLPFGEFLITRNASSPKSESECLYYYSTAIIRNVPSMPYTYHLVIRKSSRPGIANASSSNIIDDVNDDDYDAEFDDDYDYVDKSTDNRPVVSSSNGKNSGKPGNDERIFLIDESLNFESSINEKGNTTISWIDQEGDIGDKYCFVCEFLSSVDDENHFTTMIDQFLSCLYKCIYETKFKKSCAYATDEDLELLKQNKTVSPSPSSDFQRQISSISKDLQLIGDNDTNANNSEDFVEFDKEYKATKTSSDKKLSSPKNEPRNSNDEDDDEDDDDEEFVDADEKINRVDTNINSKKYIEGETLLSVTAELYYYDYEISKFVNKCKSSEVTILKSTFPEASDFEFYLAIKLSDGENKLSAKITKEMNSTFNYDKLSFIFNYITIDEDNDEDTTSWLLKFADFSIMSTFQIRFTQCLYEFSNQTTWNKVNPKDQDYVLDAFKDLKIEDEETDKAENSEDEKDDIDYDAIRRRGKTIIRDTYKQTTDTFNKKSSKNKNKLLNISFNSDRSYVVRGDKIGVFKTYADNLDTDEEYDDGNDGLQFYTAIENLKDLNGKIFKPGKSMLHEQDSSMLLMKDAPNEGNLYKLDLNKGKIVEEYNFEKNDVNLVNFAPNSKFAQMTPEKTLVGIASNSLFRIDPRLASKNCVVENEVKKYLSKTSFSCLATNSQGNIAVAGNNGEIKLFDRLGINAKTNLPGLGDTIKGLDVSADGKYILATCDTYLLLIDVENNNAVKNKNEGDSRVTGFTKSFAKDSKPIPKFLHILPQHYAIIRRKTKKPISFTVAHFNTDRRNKETTIISSGGPFVITWSLKKVINNDPEPYMIKMYSSNVIADNFSFASDKNAIVTMADDVSLLKKKNLKKLSSLK